MMRMQYQLTAALALAGLAAAGASAEPVPAPAAPPPAAPAQVAPAPAYPAGYVNPFDPNWWLATFNSLTRLYTVPAGTAYPAPAAPQAGGYVNFFDPNWWLAAQPSAAGPAQPGAAAQPAAPPAGSPYVTVETPYGPVHMFNYADPAAWNKLFAQPFAAPAR